MKFSWRLPKSSAILILDAAGSDIIRELCGTLPTHILDREKLNIPILLATLIRGRKSMREYQDMYIRRVGPQLVVTFIDNDLYFLTLKNRFPGITTVAIQNGIRANYAPRAHHGFFSLLEKADSPSCDYYCVFNHQVGKQLSRVIETTPVVTGSLKNNQFRSNSVRGKRYSIAFISQHPPRAIPKSPEGLYFGSSFVPDRDFYQADFLVANYLARFCGARSFDFIVCGKRGQDFAHEFEMFSETIGDQQWTYAPRTSDFATYETLDSANLVVSIDSTLGYEFLARGKRTAFFSVRGELTSPQLGRNVDELEFGWPAGCESNGPFWTNSPVESEFDRVMDYLITVSDDEWAREIAKYTEEVMVFDQGNTVLRELLQRLGVVFKDRVPKHA